jgi:hypothetical protein
LCEIDGGAATLPVTFLERTMKNVLLIPAMLLVFGCATNSAPPGSEPQVTLVQLSRVVEGAQFDTGPVSAHYGVEVKNVTPVPIRLDRVGVKSIGGGAYDLPSHSQGFDVAIAPGETRSVDFWAPAYVTNPTVGGANSAVTIRAMIEFDAAGKKFQTVIVQNIAPAGGN